MNICVQFTDSNKTNVAAVFGCKQDDSIYKNQDVIDTSDARYLAFYQKIDNPIGIPEPD
jgi:hypothetical protein